MKHPKGKMINRNPVAALHKFYARSGHRCQYEIYSMKDKYIGRVAITKGGKGFWLECYMGSRRARAPDGRRRCKEDSREEAMRGFAWTMQKHGLSEPEEAVGWHPPIKQMRDNTSPCVDPISNRG